MTTTVRTGNIAAQHPAFLKACELISDIHQLHVHGKTKSGIRPDYLGNENTPRQKDFQRWFPSFRKAEVKIGTNGNGELIAEFHFEIGPKSRTGGLRVHLSKESHCTAFSGADLLDLTPDTDR